MCGIVGILNFGDESLPDLGPLTERMRDEMAHRGPDGAGLWLSANGRIALGHRRLAIIDPVAAANQPMCNEDGTLWIVFNGEIYNHAEIRVELEKSGRHRFKTDHSDTEVIIHAFEEWGIDCLLRFRGMFAFGLWDERAGELWLVRDRIGVKPLYFTKRGGRLAFASEIKALLADPQQPRAIDEEALFHYLSFLTTPAPMTMFAGIQKLPGGNWLRIDREGRVTQRRYWDVWDNVQPLENVGDDEIAERILAELRTAVRLRKVSDVPVGVFLSGGIDSSTNAALFSEGESQPVRTFSIGYDQDYGSYQNELHYARAMAERVGAEHHELRLTVDDLLSFLPEMVRLQDEPIADPVCVPLYYVSKLARDNGVVVCQVGEGADELFWGYQQWKTLLQLEQWNQLPVPASVKRAGLGGLRLLGRDQGFPYEWLRRGAAGQPVFWGGAEAFTQQQKQQLLSPRLRKQFAGRNSWEALAPIYQRYQENCPNPSPLQWMSYLDLNLRLPELLLMRVDKMSMGVSLECRVPFLDHRFVELAMSIPQAVKTRHNTSKHILKKAVRGLIPDELIDRKKQGFGVPVHEWMMGKLGERIQDELRHFCAEADHIDHSAARRLMDSKRGPSQWYLLNLAMWWSHFIAGRRSVHESW